MTKFSNTTLKCLEKAGWTEHRSVPIQSYLNDLRMENYEVNAVISDFLTKFGGLKVFHRGLTTAEEDEYFEIDPTLAIEGIYRERVEDYEERVGEKLAVVGEAYNEHMVLMISLTGKMYAGYDNFLILLGNTAVTGLNTICEGREAKEIG